MEVAAGTNHHSPMGPVRYLISSNHHRIAAQTQKDTRKICIVNAIIARKKVYKKMSQRLWTGAGTELAEPVSSELFTLGDMKIAKRH